MGPRAFIYCVAALAVFVLLCGSPFPGALVGFLFGITVAFFVGPILIIIAPFLQKLGLGTSERELIYIFGGLYCLATLALFLKAWRNWRRGDFAEARLFAFQGLLFVALPLMGILSSQALVKAWR